MVRKTRFQQYQADDDIPATQQSVHELQHQIATLTAAVAALSTQRATPAIHRNDQLSAHGTYDNDDDNLFAPLRQQTRRRRRPNIDDSDSDDEDDDSAWKTSFKIELPEFKGSTNAEDLLDWFVTVEEILEFKQIPLDRCVPLIAIRFRE
ncbi:hypothetical protein Bca52824_064152 [Brassica carinata]|uniref:Uncharacterized protein n=1 Tax=Brassica carinata TaxID=52824 RepID=A0A8X7U8D2_BRACI|nr:hypothetical protein Bca52824_064152 [Brassica carinata]